LPKNEVKAPEEGKTLHIGKRPPNATGLVTIFSSRNSERAHKTEKGISL